MVIYGLDGLLGGANKSNLRWVELLDHFKGCVRVAVEEGVVLSCQVLSLRHMPVHYVSVRAVRTQLVTIVVLQRGVHGCSGSI